MGGPREGLSHRSANAGAKPNSRILPSAIRVYVAGAMDEKRTKGRQRVLKAATIEFGGGAIDCTIRNWSATGAALEGTRPVGIPAHFTLFVPADGRHWPCRVVWRKEKRIGVAFE